MALTEADAIVGHVEGAPSERDARPCILGQKDEIAIKLPGHEVRRTNEARGAELIHFSIGPMQGWQNWC